MRSFFHNDASQEGRTNQGNISTRGTGTNILLKYGYRYSSSCIVKTSCILWKPILSRSRWSFVWISHIIYCITHFKSPFTRSLSLTPFGSDIACEGVVSDFVFQGKYYFTCRRQSNEGCKFFRWARELNPPCHHGVPSNMVQFKKDGPNKIKFGQSCERSDREKS